MRNNIGAMNAVNRIGRFAGSMFVSVVFAAGGAKGQEQGDVRRFYERMAYEAERMPPFARYGDLVELLGSLRKLNRPGDWDLDDWTGESGLSTIPDGPKVWFSERAWLMLRTGDLLEHFAGESIKSRRARFEQALEYWRIVQEYSDWELEKAPAGNDDAGVMKALMLNRTRDYVGYHLVYCGLRIAKNSGVTSGDADVKALESFAALGGDYTGCIVLKEWRTLLLETHGGASVAAKSGKDSAAAQAWLAFITATEAYDALMKEHPLILKPREDGEGALPGERKRLTALRGE